jgi:hypothetical protein
MGNVEYIEKGLKKKTNPCHVKTPSPPPSTMPKTATETNLYLNRNGKHLLDQMVRYLGVPMECMWFHYTDSTSLLKLLAVRDSVRYLYILDLEEKKDAYLPTTCIKLPTNQTVSDLGSLLKRSTKQKLVSMSGAALTIQTVKSDFDLHEIVLVSVTKPRQTVEHLSFLSFTEVVVYNAGHALNPLSSFFDGKYLCNTTLDPVSGRLVKSEKFFYKP